MNDGEIADRLKAELGADEVRIDRPGFPANFVWVDVRIGRHYFKAGDWGVDRAVDDLRSKVSKGRSALVVRLMVKVYDLQDRVKADLARRKGGVS